MYFLTQCDQNQVKLTVKNKPPSSCIQRKKTVATTVTLNEDVILEIVARLPLKSAIRCLVLNKSLFHLISQLKKALVSSAYPDIEGSIFCTVERSYFCAAELNTPISSKIFAITYERDPEYPAVLDSCNGVFLLEFSKRRLCVFNPITGEAMPMSYPTKLADEFIVALAVDLNAQTTFQFKLVVAEILFRLGFEAGKEPLWRFTVFVPSSGTSWLKESPVEIIGGSIFSACNRFVYVHGCMYYADECNKRILMFDVENGKARSIDLLHEITEDDVVFLSGSLDGSLQCVYVLQEDIEIHSYDHVKEVWQSKHKITNSFVSSPMVLFCNEQRLLIVDKAPFPFPIWLEGIAAVLGTI